MLVADVFVYLDDVQYTKKDWRNTNQLKSPNGVKKVTVPVSNASRNININEALISYNIDWECKIFNQLKQWYGKAQFYNDVIQVISPIINNKYKRLVDLNYDLNKLISEYIGISTNFYFSSIIPKETDEKNLRILEICKYFKNVNLLYDGKSASNFLDTNLFKKNDIDVVFQNYIHSSYNQLWGNFVPYMSILDLIMNNSANKSLEIISKSPLSNKLA